jgi:hypothetical protein
MQQYPLNAEYVPCNNLMPLAKAIAEPLLASFVKKHPAAYYWGLHVADKQ